MANLHLGMRCDIHPTLQPDGSYRDSYDGGVVVTVDRQLAWMPMKGTTPVGIIFEGVKRTEHPFRILKVISSIGSRSIWIMLKASEDRVGFYSATYVTDQLTLTTICEFTATAFFGCAVGDLPSAKVLDAFGYSNGNDKSFVYLTTGKGQPLCVPVHTFGLNPSLESCYYLPEAAGFSLNPTCISGSLPCGAYTFTAQLYNDFGATTPWTTPSQWLELSTRQWEGHDKSFADYKMLVYRCALNGLSGGGSTDRSSYGVLLTPANIPAGYKLRIACFLRGREGASTVGDIIYEGIATTVSYTEAKSLRKVLHSDIMVQGTELHNVQSLDFNIDVQAAAGFTEKDGLLDSLRSLVDNGTLDATRQPTITTVARKVQKYLDGVAVASTTADPCIDELPDAIFAPGETYEIAGVAVTRSGSKGVPVVLGRITMPDNAVSNGSTTWVNTPIYTGGNALSVPSLPVNDIQLANLDLTVFSDPAIDHVELLYRNASNRIVGYAVARSPMKHNDENAGGMLPAGVGVDDYKTIYSSNLILHMPEHLFGYLDASELKDCTVELMDCYSYTYSYTFKDIITIKDEGVVRLTGMGSHQIKSAMELKYDNSNSVIFEGITGTRRNSTALDGTNAWGYGAKSLLVKLSTSYNTNGKPFFGWCRIVRQLQSATVTPIFRSSGVRVRLSECTLTGGKLMAPTTKLSVGDTYARRFTVQTVTPNNPADSKSIAECVTIPSYSKLDIAQRVGNHSYTAGTILNFGDGDGIQLSVNYTTGFAKLEDFSLHDHFTESNGQFTYALIQEELRTAMKQHIRWNVKRTANARYDELRRFLANDIVAANLSAGRIQRVLFSGSDLFVVQQTAIGRMPYNEKVAITSKAELMLGTGKEFASYYPMVEDGASSRDYVCRFANDIAVYLDRYDGIVGINANITPLTDLQGIDILKQLGIASHPLLSKGKLCCSQPIDGVTYFSVGSYAIMLSNAMAVGITSALPEHTVAIEGEHFSVSDSANGCTLHRWSGDYSQLLGRVLIPSLTVTVHGNSGEVVEPLALFLPDLRCAVKDIAVSYQEVATGGYEGWNAMEQRNHRRIDSGWKLSLPLKAVGGYVKRISGPYVTIKLTFPSDSIKLANFGSINEYDVSIATKR